MSIVLAECRLSIGRVAVKYRRVSADMRVGRESADMSTESQPTCRPTLGRHVCRLSVDLSAESVNRQRSLLHMIPEFNNCSCHVQLRITMVWIEDDCNLKTIGQFGCKKSL